MINPLVIGKLFDLGGQVFDRVFPDKAAAAEAKAQLAQELANLDQAELNGFRDFMLQYEGAAEKVHPLIQILRGSVRPVLTYAMAGVFAWGFANPKAIDSDTMQMLFQLNLLSMGFWFGERALKNLGLKLTRKPEEQ